MKKIMKKPNRNNRRKKKNKYTDDYIQGYRDGWNSRAKVLIEELASSVITHRK